ncbi:MULTISPECIES: ATP-binding protein [unclassified Leptolyngbya]|uniref:ATP-binding protein n=1 Tax=unclassified Leptolyngbya TaxID=2650499 RepID=UPI001688B364|nr:MULTISPECIES: ATP-binding protein [unclassified Leptolyngbya]MBD1911774.1 hypothetical protein [Leptolyngbya sp. FACHB-8]MBD2153336.1 hypothetical protein [Leptolyngbya sp. FACHB-16]
MSPQLKNPFLLESSQLTGQIGSAFILHLFTQLREMETLARSIALTVAHLPPHDELIQQVVPEVLNYQGDRLIAGGGIWFEPYQFHPDKERCSFFWARNSAGTLVFLDGYNQAEAGYHRESWYVVGPYAKPGQSLWSKSYMDPYSRELMITCTTPIFKDANFAGVVTVDLTLESLQTRVNWWQQKSGGYIFILDRNNQFITFPDREQVTRTYTTRHGKKLEKFISIHEFVETFPLFSPFLTMVNEMDGVVLGEASARSSSYADIAQILSQGSDMEYEEGQMFAAILADPLNSSDRTDYLFQKYELDRDGLLQEPAIAFLFHVPEVYWKVFIVISRSEVNATTHNLIQADKMATLGQMLVGVTHELNNPLNFLVGNLSHAQHYMLDLLNILNLYQLAYPEPPPDIEKTAEQIDLEFLKEDLPKLLSSMQIGADRTSEIIKALKRFSRFDDEEYKSTDLHEGIDNTLLLLSNRLKSQSKKPGIQVQRKYGNLPLVECFPGQLNQVFMNVLVNAIDALQGTTPAKNQLTPEYTPTISVHTDVVRSGWVMISIQDNGPGIPPEVQEQIFTPFFTTKALGKGTGLGLAICRQIITERHGGTLRFTSTPGEGTEFVIELPVQAHNDE